MMVTTLVLPYSLEETSLHFSLEKNGGGTSSLEDEGPPFWKIDPPLWKIAPSLEDKSFSLEDRSSFLENGGGPPPSSLELATLPFLHVSLEK